MQGSLAVWDGCGVSGWVAICDGAVTGLSAWTFGEGLMDPVVDTLSPRGLLIRLDLWLSARCILSSHAWCALALVGGP